MAQVVQAHSRILAGEGVRVCPSPDPLETCPYEVRMAEGDKTLIAKVASEYEGELIKSALLCMYQQLGQNAPAVIKSDIQQKLGKSLHAEIEAPRR